MENNLAYVAKLSNFQKIEGADKIKLASVVLNGVPTAQIIVGVDTEDNTPVVYFDSNLCIEQFFIDSIDGLSPDQGKETFSSLGKYLAKHNRVRSIKLKGVISSGLAVELDKVMKAYNLSESFEEGYSFDHIGDSRVCFKYTVPEKFYSTKEGKQVKRIRNESRIIPGQFAFHVDTLQLKRNLHMVNPYDVASISSKWHGTSMIISNCLVKRKLSLGEKVLQFIKLPVKDTTYDYVFASRKVIKNKSLQGFYSEDIWSRAGKEQFVGKLHEGETVYAEIVGYLGDGKFIQKGYTYGCNPNEYAVRVYRMTKTGPDGDVVEYSWPKLRQRCKEMNVKLVDEFYYGRLVDKYDIGKPDLTNEEEVSAWRLLFLEKLTAEYLEKDIPGANGKKVPDEGIVIKIDSGGEEVYKLKSDKFFVHETKMFEQGEEDLEDTQSGTEDVHGQF